MAGGYDEEVCTNTAVLDMQHSNWQSAPPLVVPRAGGFPPIPLDQRHVLFAGGASDFSTQPAREALVLDMATLQWDLVDLELPLGAAVAHLGGSLLAAGGRDDKGDPVATVTLWTWTDS